MSTPTLLTFDKLCCAMCIVQEYFDKNGEPLFSSHMLDLSEEVDEENIGTCKAYLERMHAMKVSDIFKLGLALQI